MLKAPDPRFLVVNVTTMCPLATARSLVFRLHGHPLCRNRRQWRWRDVRPALEPPPHQPDLGRCSHSVHFYLHGASASGRVRHLHHLCALLWDVTTSDGDTVLEWAERRVQDQVRMLA